MGFRRSLALWAWLLVLAGLVAAGSGAASEIPPPAGPITDRAGVLGQDARQRLTRILDDVRERTGAEIAVLVVPSTAPDSIEDYSIAVFDRWKIGQQGKDNGLLFLVAVQDRRMRITTGYGLEAILPDGKVGEIRDRAIIPLFRAGRYADGIVRGTEALAAAILSPAAATTGPATQAPPRRRAGRVGGRWTGVLLAVFVLLILFSVAAFGGGPTCRSGWPRGRPATERLAALGDRGRRGRRLRGLVERPAWGLVRGRIRWRVRGRGIRRFRRGRIGWRRGGWIVVGLHWPDGRQGERVDDPRCRLKSKRSERA